MYNIYTTQTHTHTQMYIYIYKRLYITVVVIGTICRVYISYVYMYIHIYTHMYIIYAYTHIYTNVYTYIFICNRLCLPMVVIRIIEYVEVCTGLLELDLQSYCRLCIYIYTQYIIYRIV